MPSATNDDSTSQVPLSRHSQTPAPYKPPDDVSISDLDGADDIPRPPISPITPTSSTEDFAQPHFSANMSPNSSQHNPSFIARPDPVPIDEESNPDITALKAAASVLQIQKQKAQRDIQTLKNIRDAAVQDPEGFSQELRSGRLRHEPDRSNPLKATFEDVEGEDSESDDDDVHMSDSRDTSGNSKFNVIPSAQNVVHCPPINWEKYHVVGESLDRLHEKEKERPSPGQPWSEERKAIITAPYSPFRDRPPVQQQSQQPQSQQSKPPLPPPMQTRRSRRESQG